MATSFILFFQPNLFEINHQILDNVRCLSSNLEFFYQIAVHEVRKCMRKMVLFLKSIEVNIICVCLRYAQIQAHHFHMHEYHRFIQNMYYKHTHRLTHSFDVYHVTWYTDKKMALTMVTSALYCRCIDVRNCQRLFRSGEYVVVLSTATSTHHMHQMLWFIEFGKRIWCIFSIFPKTIRFLVEN